MKKHKQIYSILWNQLEDKLNKIYPRLYVKMAQKGIDPNITNIIDILL